MSTQLIHALQSATHTDASVVTLNEDLSNCLQWFYARRQQKTLDAQQEQACQRLEQELEGMVLHGRPRLNQVSLKDLRERWIATLVRLIVRLP